MEPWSLVWAVVGGVFVVIGGVATIIQLSIWIRNVLDSRIDSIKDLERHSLRLIEKIKSSGFKPDFVVGVGRSGAFLGGYLAGNMGSLRIEVIDRIVRPKPGEPQSYAHADRRFALLKDIYGDKAKVLVVAGAQATGNTFVKFRELVAAQAPNWDCKYCVLYTLRHLRDRLDYYERSIWRVPRRFPWHRSADWIQTVKPG